MDEVKVDFRDQLTNDLRAKFASATFEEKLAIQNRLWYMIQYAIGRHDYWENYRTRYLTIAAALLALASAGISVLVNARVTELGGLLFYAAFIALGVTAVLLIDRFRRETSPDYPYRAVSKVTSWIFLYTLKRDEKELLKDFKKKDARKRAIEEYVGSLKEFTSSWMKLDEIGRMQEDLEQVLILYTLQRYKRVFARRMASILRIGSIATLGLISAGVFVYFLPLLLALLPK